MLVNWTGWLTLLCLSMNSVHSEQCSASELPSAWYSEPIVCWLYQGWRIWDDQIWQTYREDTTTEETSVRKKHLEIWSWEHVLKSTSLAEVCIGMYLKLIWFILAQYCMLFGGYVEFKYVCKLRNLEYNVYKI